MQQPPECSEYRGGREGISKVKELRLQFERGRKARQEGGDTVKTEKLSEVQKKVRKIDQIRAPGNRGGVAGAWERQKREGGKITGGGVGKLAGTTREQANGKIKFNVHR